MSTLRLLLGQKGVAVLLFNYFLMNTGFFMLVPFIAVYGTRDLGMSAAEAGLVLGMRQFVQQGLAVFGGLLGDRIGYRSALALGMLVRAAGFASFALAADMQGLAIAALISALGGAFFESSGNAALAMLAPHEHRAAAFSLYGIASRLGGAVGPVLGIILLGVNFGVLSVVSASLYVAGFVMLTTLMPQVRPPARTAAQGPSPSLGQTLGAVLHNRSFVALVAINSGYWFLFAQFTISLPLYVLQRFGGLESIGAYYFINSLPAVVAQYVLLDFLNRRLSRPWLLTCAMAIIALGIGTIGWWSIPLLVVVSASVYALGDLLYQPTQYTLTSDLARHDALAIYFGFAAYALAVGGGAGNVLGGLLFDAATVGGHPENVWTIYGAVGVTIMLLLGWWARRMPLDSR